MYISLNLSISFKSTTFSWVVDCSRFDDDDFWIVVKGWSIVLSWDRDGEDKGGGGGGGGG